MPAAATAKRPDYRRAIDLLRFLAAAGIVMDHTMGWAVVGYPALGLFLILTSFFSVGSYRRSGGANFWSARAKRMLIPWLFWCAVYRVVWEVISDAPFQLLSNPFTLLIGPSIHLWFLPFAAGALAFIPAIARDVETKGQLTIACIVLVPVAVMLGLIHAKTGLQGWQFAGSPVPQPVPQWAYALPIYLWGALAAVSHRIGAPHLTLIAAAVASGVMLALDWNMASYQLILCAVVFEIVYRLRWQGDWMTGLAGYAFGIYLLHPAFALVGYKLVGPQMDKGLGFAIAFFGAWAGTWACKRLPVLNGLV